MTREHLIPITQRSPERAREICSMGGKVGGEKASIAAKLTWLRRGKKKLTNGQISFLDEMLTNPNASLGNILNTIEDKKHLMSPEDYIRFSQVQHKLMHGEKHINYNLNVNVDVEAELKDIDAHIFTVIKEK